MPVKSQKQRPWQSIQMERIEALGLRGPSCSILLAAVKFANPHTGEFRCSVKTLASLSGWSERCVQEHLRSLERSGIILAVTDKRGGAKRTVTYAVPIFIVTRNGAHVAPLATDERVQAVQENGAADSEKGAREAVKGCTPCTRRTNTKNFEEPTQQSEAVCVLRALGLGDELLRHPNATPERLEWLVSEVRKETTKNPVGLATEAIRKAWNPPTLAPGGALGIGAAERARELVEGLEPEARASLLKQVRRDMRNLANLPDDDVSVVGAIAKLADPKRRKVGDGSYWWEEIKIRNLCDESASGVEGEGPLGLPPF